MQKPAMILFDYGHTLLYEHTFDTLAGTRALMAHATRNEHGLTDEEVSDAVSDMFNQLWDAAHPADVEINQILFNKLAYGLLGVEFSLDSREAEAVFWDAAGPARPMEGAGGMLEYLKGAGIRTGVISNISFSGGTLASRVRRLLPQGSFEFILSSADVQVRKPHPFIFRAALAMAGLPPGQVWYCGDNVRCDIEGGHAAGIFPVWYRCGLPCPYRDNLSEPPPTVPHLEIRHWAQLVQILEGL